MCGRTACTLAPDVICRACTYQAPAAGDSGGGDGGGGGKYKTPVWRDHPPSKENGPGAYAYYPSANAAPTRFTPVMILKTKEEKEDDAEEDSEVDREVDREVTPMMFGMIPHYHKGSSKNHGLSTNNCRLEGLATSKLYRRSWTGRRFCVVLCQGFYEWKTTGVGEAKGVKRQPYLIYAPQPETTGPVAEGTSWEGEEKWSEEEGWRGPQLLKMAGLYDVWRDPQTGDEVFSYTIITMESNDTLKWLHHRMPAILDSEEKVTAWLEAGRRGLGDKEVLELLKPVEELRWHKVDAKVGNSRCHDGDCMREVVEGERKVTALDKWLVKKVKKEEVGEGEEEGKVEVKRAKLEGDSVEVKKEKEEGN